MARRRELVAAGRAAPGSRGGRGSGDAGDRDLPRRSWCGGRADVSDGQRGVPRLATGRLVGRAARRVASAASVGLSRCSRSRAGRSPRRRRGGTRAWCAGEPGPGVGRLPGGAGRERFRRPRRGRTRCRPAERGVRLRWDRAAGILRTRRAKLLPTGAQLVVANAGLTGAGGPCRGWCCPGVPAAPAVPRGPPRARVTPSPARSRRPPAGRRDAGGGGGPGTARGGRGGGEPRVGGRPPRPGSGD